MKLEFTEFDNVPYTKMLVIIMQFDPFSDLRDVATRYNSNNMYCIIIILKIYDF